MSEKDSHNRGSVCVCVCVCIRMLNPGSVRIPHRLASVMAELNKTSEVMR